MNNKSCKHCGTTNDANTSFCRSCGQPLYSPQVKKQQQLSFYTIVKIVFWISFVVTLYCLISILLKGNDPLTIAPPGHIDVEEWTQGFVVCGIITSSLFVLMRKLDKR